MIRYLKRFLLLVLLLAFGGSTPLISAQDFPYEGLYLTSDETQRIHGFYFDQTLQRILVFQNGIAQTDRLDNLLQYIDQHVNFDEMTRDEVAEFNQKYGIDYAAALRKVSEKEFPQEADATGFERLFVDLEVPGIYNTILGERPLLTATEYKNEDALSMALIINQPNIQLQQDLWHVTLFDITTPILRFEANQDTSQIKDDFGIIYEKQAVEIEFNF